MCHRACNLLVLLLLVLLLVLLHPLLHLLLLLMLPELQVTQKLSNFMRLLLVCVQVCMAVTFTWLPTMLLACEGLRLPPAALHHEAAVLRAVGEDL